MQWDSTWVFALVVAVLLLALAQAGPSGSLSEQPLVMAAGAFLTVPVSLLSALAVAPLGIILLPLGFIALIWYLRALDYVLGDALLIFVVFAAAVVILSR